jgi:hypothetical protein
MAITFPSLKKHNGKAKMLSAFVTSSSLLEMNSNQKIVPLRHQSGHCRVFVYYQFEQSTVTRFNLADRLLCPR